MLASAIAAFFSEEDRIRVAPDAGPRRPGGLRNLSRIGIDRGMGNPPHPLPERALRFFQNDPAILGEVRR
jgi:hypothetical protein